MAQRMASAMLLTLIALGGVAGPSGAQTIVEAGSACGGHWVAPGNECRFIHQVDPVPFGGFALATQGGTPTVTVEVVLPGGGPDGGDLVLGRCSDDLVVGPVAWCGDVVSLGVAGGTELVCRVRGADEGGFGCATDP